MPLSPDAKHTAWIFQTGEPLPSDPGHPRAMRAISLANALVDDGYRVILWSSAFFHQEKRHRSGNYKRILVNDNIEVRLIPSPGYQRNIGLGRLFDHGVLAWSLLRQLRKETDVPDVAFVGYPPIEFAAVAIAWLKKHSVPTMLDAKDQWPDIFVAPLPKIAQPIAKLMLFPYFFWGRKAMRDATALCSMAPSFLEWMRYFSGRKPHEFDIVCPLSPGVDDSERGDGKAEMRWWRDRGVNDDGCVRFFFVGSITNAFDFGAIRYAAQEAAARRLNWQFVICGNGGAYDTVKDKFSGMTNVVWPGWVDRPQLIWLSSVSLGGLAPYRNSADFQKSIPNKVIDYMALGQPIICPLDGEVRNLIESGAVGLSYSDTNFETFFNCLHRLSTEDGLRDQLSSNALTIYLEQYRGTVVYQRLSKRLQSMASRSHV